MNIEHNLFSINKKLTEEEYTSMPSRLAIDIDLAERFINLFDENFYRLALNNSIKEINPREHQMNLYVFGPVDFLEFLIEYEKLNIDEKEKFLASIKNKRPGAWLSRNYIPLKNSESLSKNKYNCISNYNEK